MGILVEFLRRFGNATANAAVGFLFSQDIPRSQAEGEATQSQSEGSSDEHGKISPPKAPETVQNSPLESFGQALAESMESLGAGHDHEAEIPLTPETPGQEEGMHH